MPRRRRQRRRSRSTPGNRRRSSVGALLVALALAACNSRAPIFVPSESDDTELDTEADIEASDTDDVAPADTASDTDDDSDPTDEDTALGDSGNDDPPDSEPAGDVDAAHDTQAVDGSDADVEPLPDDPSFIAFDAAIDRGNGKLYFFAGTEYFRYDWGADVADDGYPRETAEWWPDVFDADIDAAFVHEGIAYYFKGAEVVLYDLGSDSPLDGYPRAITDELPGAFASDVDAAFSLDDGVAHLIRGTETVRVDLSDGSALDDAPVSISERWPGIFDDGVDAAIGVGTDRAYFFRGGEYTRWNVAESTTADGYPRVTKWWWPGLWDPHEFTGHYDERLPADIEARLWTRPPDDEIAARRARVDASAGSDYDNISDDYPLYLASIEDRLKVWGCAILRRTDGSGVHRFRCATNQDGPFALDIEPYTIPYVDWRNGAHHSIQVSQGDLSADPGTPVSIFGTDDGTFSIVRISWNQPTGSISGGLNIRVGFTRDGEYRELGWSHLNDNVPTYVIEAWEDENPLPVGTVFGFIGYTGNLWMAAPPEVDAPYSGTGGGLPVSHSHIWFKDSAGDHEGMRPSTRELIDFSGRYPYGGG